jgi:uncharacterized protein YcbX
MKISQLYKYPIKSLTPLKSESLVLNSNGYIDGDRLFGFRFQNAGERDNYEWQRKTSFAALMHMPQIARLKVDFDETSRNLIIKNADEIIVDANIDLERTIIEEKFTDFVLQSDKDLIKKFPERFPFMLIGGESHAHFHDGAQGGVTLHSQESLDELNNQLGYQVEHARFRSNIIIEGVKPWEEFDWIGKNVTINNLNFTVEKPVTRCLAINCNPLDGTRDKNVLKSMLDFQDAKPPEFSVKLIPLNTEGQLSVGDSVYIN